MSMIDHDWILITISLSNYFSRIKITISLYKLQTTRTEKSCETKPSKTTQDTAHQYTFKRSIIQPLFFILACICFLLLSASVLKS